LGRIGQEVAARAKAFGMAVIGFDPFLAGERAKKLGITKVEQVKDLLPDVDYLTVHTLYRQSIIPNGKRIVHTSLGSQHRRSPS